MRYSLWFLLGLASITGHAQDSSQIRQQVIKPTLDDVSAAGSQPPDKQASMPTRADDARTQKILNNLAARAGWFPEIKITVADGLVTLKGRAKDAEQLQWLAKTADRIPTVIAVINQVELETPAATDLSPAWKEFKSLVEQAKKALPLTLLALCLMTIFWFAGSFIGRGVSRLWGRHISNPFLLATISRLTMLPIWLLFFYLVLQTAGLSALATTIIGGTGALGIVIGFAFKDIAENYLSGLLLAMRSPFTKGDEIQIDKFEGYVQSLNMRGTTIIDYDGNVVLIPNRIVIQSVIKNVSSSPKTRASFEIGIAYGDSVPQAQELIYRALCEIPAILKDPAPLVVATALSPLKVTLRVMFWYDCIKSSKFRTTSQAIALSKAALMVNKFGLRDELASPFEPRLSTAEADAIRAELRGAPSTTSAPREAGSEQGGHERDVIRANTDTDALKKNQDQSLVNP